MGDKSAELLLVMRPCSPPEVEQLSIAALMLGNCVALMSRALASAKPGANGVAKQDVAADHLKGRQRRQQTATT